MRKTILAVMVVMVSSGCASLTHQQAADYDVWKSQGKVIQEKSVPTAFWMGLLPGGGSFYTRQWGIAVVDLLLWPFSVLWDPGVGAAGAKKINFEATKYAMDTGRVSKN